MKTIGLNQKLANSLTFRTPTYNIMNKSQPLNKVATIIHICCFRIAPS